MGSAEGGVAKEEQSTVRWEDALIVPVMLSSELKNERFYMTDFLSHRCDKGL